MTVLSIRRLRKAHIVFAIATLVPIVFYMFQGEKGPSILTTSSQPKPIGDTGTKTIDLNEVIDDAARFQSSIYPALSGIYPNTEELGQPTDPVFLESYIESGVDKIIVPFAHGGQVISLAFMRSSSSNRYKPDQLIDVSEKNWTQYPPLSSVEADQMISEQYPLEPYERISGLYHLGYPIPFYQYINLQDSGRRFLVNAVSGSVTEAPLPAALEEQAEARKAADMPPIRQTDDGLIEIVEERAHDMSSQERQQLEKEIVESNKAIEDGLLKIGPDFEVIYDKR